VKTLIKSLMERYRGHFPVVMKGKLGNGKKSVTVIYRDHSELYELVSEYRGQEDLPYDPYSEIEMARGNRDKRIDYQGRNNDMFIGNKEDDND